MPDPARDLGETRQVGRKMTDKFVSPFREARQFYLFFFYDRSRNPKLPAAVLSSRRKISNFSQEKEREREKIDRNGEN